MNRYLYASLLFVIGIILTPNASASIEDPYIEELRTSFQNIKKDFSEEAEEKLDDLKQIIALSSDSDERYGGESGNNYGADT